MVLEVLADKLDLLHRVIGDRFLYKKMVTGKQGIRFISRTGEALSPAQLSSGEHHELVLFFNLLFQIQPGTLILIDEPEISLHVAWQLEFLRDLRDAAKLAGIDVLLATHSPSIVKDHWDLTVQLKGPDPAWLTSELVERETGSSAHLLVTLLVELSGENGCAKVASDREVKDELTIKSAPQTSF